MAYEFPKNPAPLAPDAKRQMLKEYYTYCRELARQDPEALNRKVPRSALMGTMDRIGTLLIEEAKSLAEQNEEVREFLAQNKPPGMMSHLLPDDFRAFCLLLNGLKQWLAAQQNATDRYLLGGTARPLCREMSETCLVTGERLTDDMELHHPVRDGRPPIPLSKQGHRLIEKQTSATGLSGGDEGDPVALAVQEIRTKGHFSWNMLRRGCRQILGLATEGGTAGSNASARTFARQAMQKANLNAEDLLAWMDANGLGLERGR
ncbi:conserved protein of unknown function (plasmid) [Rhodovastum atsumiense]|uniref:Uncharacterized protein n=1 Tax=Rhodovastum atsumiense TaxID=504468 RepID=A0A5M6IVM1_9PROT|nr:hypothetical protein [Rhodovastum atsumiense]KAA5611897.1 hypothetical protein F1189_12765 [Rhodovastum atsumiense]CAH2606123.1 conserved protein of unknown function [Rhodovastum atsumiense]